MSNLVARHSFRNLPALMVRANRAFDVPSFVGVLRSANHSSPDVKTAQHIIYRFKPIKGGMAQGILDAFQRIMRKEELLAPNERLSLEAHTFEYNSYLPDLAHVIQTSQTTGNDPEIRPLSTLAAHVGCEEIVLREMMSGHERLVPTEFAERVAEGAMMICRLSAPLRVVRCSANERIYKPIGGDTGRPPEKCGVSIAARKALVGWYEEQDERTAPRAA
jgi:hypothetical protein